ncbi:hypothetical protein BT69DRAFT_1294707 [Atractiella rhizophila]|nr:hypothetical protein BT69DRAFT_1294707 [Atractiella rhizophila]
MQLSTLVSAIFLLYPALSQAKFEVVFWSNLCSAGTGTGTYLGTVNLEAVGCSPVPAGAHQGQPFTENVQKCVVVYPNGNCGSGAVTVQVKSGQCFNLNAATIGSSSIKQC